MWKHDHKHVRILYEWVNPAAMDQPGNIMDHHDLKQTNRSCFVDTERYTRFSQRFLRYEWILCSWTARLWPPWTHEMAIILAVSLQLERRMTCWNFSGARWHGTQCIGCGLTVSHLLFFLFPAWRSFKADELHAFGFLAPGVVGILIDIDYWNPHHSITSKWIIRFRTPMLRLLSINRILLIESPRCPKEPSACGEIFHGFGSKFGTAGTSDWATAWPSCQIWSCAWNMFFATPRVDSMSRPLTPNAPAAKRAPRVVVFGINFGIEIEAKVCVMAHVQSLPKVQCPTQLLLLANPCT